MQSLIMVFALLVGVFWPYPGAHAAPAMLHAECLVVGPLIKTEERVEQRDPSWAASWGIPSSKSYLDATVMLTRSTVHVDEGYNNCPEKTGEHVFQIRSDWEDWYQALEPGSCIQSRNRFSGDEFSIGDWLFDSELVPAERCSQ